MCVMCVMRHSEAIAGERAVTQVGLSDNFCRYNQHARPELAAKDP